MVPIVALRAAVLVAQQRHDGLLRVGNIKRDIGYAFRRPKKQDAARKYLFAVEQKITREERGHENLKERTGKRIDKIAKERKQRMPGLVEDDIHVLKIADIRELVKILCGD